MYEEYFKQEIHFLMFTSSTEPKEIEVCYPDDISWIPERALAEAKLYQDNTCINVSYTLKKGLNKDELIIELNEFTPEFNRIVINLEDNSTVSLSIPQCYLENMSDLDDLDDLSITWFAGNGHSQTRDNKITMERSFKKGLNEKRLDGELSVLINNKAVGLDYIKKNSIEILSNSDKQINTYYTLELNKDRLIQENIHRIVIESVWVVENDKLKVSVLENHMPMYLTYKD